MYTEVIRFTNILDKSVGRWEIYPNCFFYATTKPNAWNKFWFKFFLGWKWEDTA